VPGAQGGSRRGDPVPRDHATCLLERRALRFLDGREPLLATRPRAWRIVNGHGDVLTGAIFYLDDGPRVLDCLEFGLAWPCARPSHRGTHVRSGASVSAWALRVSICEVALAPVTLTDLPQAR
jgi:hypothetical protein